MFSIEALLHTEFLESFAETLTWYFGACQLFLLDQIEYLPQKLFAAKILFTSEYQVEWPSLVIDFSQFNIFLPSFFCK